MDHKDLREEVAATARRMVSSGLVKGTSGNVSARTPEGDALVTPSGLDYSELGPENVVLVDLDGNLLDGAWKPSTETPMHTGIYRARPEDGGIVHNLALLGHARLPRLGDTPEEVAEVAAKISGYGKARSAESESG